MMEEARPAKRVRFLDVAPHDPCSANPTESSFNSKSNQKSSPSAEDICKWTTTDKATAACFIRDVHAMRPTIGTAPDASFYWLGHIPCRSVLIVGVVVGIDVCERWTVYTVDDSTAVIECTLRHPAPYAHLDRKLYTLAMLRELRQRAPPPPPPNVTAIGYPVQVIGKVLEIHGQRRINAKTIKPCDSTNDQWGHLMTVTELHKTKYAVPKPFEIPADVHSHGSPPRKSKPALPQPSSSLVHSTTSDPISFAICGYTNPPKFRHPSQLRTSDLTDKTFQLYVKHFLNHAPALALHWDFPAELTQSTHTPEVQTASGLTSSSSAPPTGPAGFTLSYLRRIPALNLLASLVVNAETRRRQQVSAQMETPSKFPKPNSRRWIPPSKKPHRKMKRLFMWAVYQLHNEGSIVLCDRPFTFISGMLTIPLFEHPDNSETAHSSLFSSPDRFSSMSSLPNDDGYLSDPPPYEEDEAYVAVTSAVLAGPIQQIMHAKGIRGKSTAVGAQDILKELKRLNARWAMIRLQDVEEALGTIIVD